MQLTLACQQSMIRVQHTLRFTMQDVYDHSENSCNECADHAAALGTYGPISRHYVTSRWVRRTIDSDGCFNGCFSISETLERLQHIRTNTATFHQDRVYLALGLLTVFLVVFQSAPYVCSYHVSHLLSAFCFFVFSESLLSLQVMGRLSSSTSTVPSFDDYFAHNMWNPLLDWHFFEQVSVISASLVFEIDLAEIEMSCEFSLDLLCHKEGFIGHYCQWTFFICGTMITTLAS